MSKSKVFLFDNSDPEMQKAYENARASFRYFWRECAWERRRIVPGLDLACVKAPFSDGRKRNDGNPDVEQMWMSDVDFDGETISGTLLNSPNWLKTVHQGDEAGFTLDEITDWMYAIQGEVYGAYTVNLMRSRMGRKERRDHDEAWGLDFGDPEHIRVVPEPAKGEHPMSEAMASKLKEQLKKNPKLLTETDDRGWTLLHQEALAGSAPTVEVLLAAGADRRAETNRGKTPIQLAKVLGWKSVIEIFIRY